MIYPLDYASTENGSLLYLCKFDLISIAACPWGVYCGTPVEATHK